MAIVSAIKALASAWRARAEAHKDLQRVLEGSLRQFDLVSVRGKAPDVSRQALVDRYRHWAFICASRNAIAVASVPLRLFATRTARQPRARRQSKRVGRKLHSELASRAHLASLKQVRQADEIEEITDHPFLDLMRQVNPHTNQFDLMELTQTFLDVTGDSFWLLEMNGAGLPVNIWLLRSQWVTIMPDKEKFVKGYRFGRERNNQVEFAPEDVVHFKRPNPRDPFYGMGALQASATAVDRYTAMDSHEQALNENNARPDFVVKYKSGRLTPAQRREVEAEWNNALRGVKNAGKAKIADMDFDIEKLGFTPREMAFLQGRKWTRLEIADAFGVPLALLDTETVNKANAETALLHYLKFTIVPHLTRIEQKINERIMPLYGRGQNRLFVAFDNPVPEDIEAKLRQDESDVKNFIRSINQIREARGLEPAAWGEVPLVPLNLAPLGSAQPQPVGESGQRGLKQEPPAPGGISGGANPRLSKQEIRIAASVEEAWRDQERLIIGQLERQGRVDIADAVSVAGLSEELREPMEQELMRGARRGAGEIGTTVTRMRINLAEWVTEPTRQKWVDDNLLRFAKKIEADLADDLTRELGEGIIEGESVPSLKRRVRGALGKFATPSRAEMIARSESARAVMGGREMLWQDSGVVEGKAWSAVSDSCPFCQDMEIQFGPDAAGKPLGAPFVEQGEGREVGFEGRTIRLSTDFSDIPYPPLHPNCRCTIVPIVST